MSPTKPNKQMNALPNVTVEQLTCSHDHYLIYVRPGPGGYVTDVTVASVLLNGPPRSRDGTPLILPRTRLYSAEDLAFGMPAVSVDYGFTTYEEEFESPPALECLDEDQIQELRDAFAAAVAENVLYDAARAREEGINEMIQAGDFSFLDGPDTREDWQR